ncbi:MAG: family 10 glycosylhydrolase [Acidobacteria bacterium]|nr:family 10 glycosylhydrolase [Acidobacteriota bacterium]MBI3424392.1 family 10 glycosylhydrolase [Acidobacteriota bacterium]
MKAILSVSSVSLFLLLLSARILAQAGLQPSATQSGQYRGFWIDTFNTTLNNHNEVLAIIADTKRAHCNALFVQVRRRGDSWYRNSLEPLADRTPIEAGFDPLADLIAEAHANNIEVHAFVIVGALWNGNPTANPPRPPESPQHAFNRHGFNQATGKLYEGRDNWLTRTLLADDGTNVSFNGHRIGNDFWLDLGHPDAAQYTFDVLLHLVRNYDLDGLHLDRIRYPEVTATQSGGASIGYNAVNVARFQTRYGLAEGSTPALTDARWQQWRRDQVTNLVRRVYLNAIALKPRLKISGALIAFGGGPTTESAWQSAEAYWRVFQDWRAWTEEGILDLAIPMNYKREHVMSQVPLFSSWYEWTKDHAYDRAVLHGLGSYLNSLEGTLHQIRASLVPSRQGNPAMSGVVFFSFANTNDAVAANPFTGGRDTPRRAFAEFAAALTTGKSVDGTQSYEVPDPSIQPVFPQSVPVPVLPWKAAPQLGHVMGLVKNNKGAVSDTAEVLLTRLTADIPPTGRANIRTTTDGNGFYGGVDLAPGRYRVTVTPVGEPPYTPDAPVRVVAGKVTNFDILLERGGTVPYGAASVSAASFSGPTLAPETIVAAFGNGLATSTAAATGLPLPTTLATTTVKLKDSAGVERAAPLFFVSPQQINYLIPAETAAGLASVSIEVLRDGFLFSVLGNPLNIVRAAPGLFTANANGSGAPAAVVLRFKADGTQSTESVAQLDTAQNRFVPQPIEVGVEGDRVFLILFGTGVRGAGPAETVTAQVNGLPLDVLFSGALSGFAGLDQINLRLSREVLQALAGRGETELLLFADNRLANTVQLVVKGQ